MIKINEIFFSIQGESTRAGLPTIFIRTSGCHLRCTYCDTTYAYHDGDFLSLEDILTEVGEHSAKNVCVTGGEPLLQNEVPHLLTLLCDRGYDVSLETCGDKSCLGIDSRVHKVVDIKTPDSGEKNRFNFENLELDPVNTEFKFVICSEKDFIWAQNFLTETRLTERFQVLYSPAHGDVDQHWLAQKILSQKMNVRLQLQLHKYIWSPTARGV